MFNYYIFRNIFKAVLGTPNTIKEVATAANDSVKVEDPKVEEATEVESNDLKDGDVQGNVQEESKPEPTPEVKENVQEEPKKEYESPSWFKAAHNVIDDFMNNPEKYAKK